jgi:hypothetical protein
MDLSQYINFAAVLTKAGVSPQIVLTDTGSYPAGIPQQLIGWFSVTQPDGLTVGGSPTSPNVTWSGTGLTPATFALRLDNANGFQQGTYAIQYSIRVPGYTDTILSRNVYLTYISPVLAMSNTLDEFTPDLKVSDLTGYDQSGWTTVSVTRNWSVLINNVLGTERTITGTTNPFDMNYQGSYYDSLYDITLTATPNYQLQGNTWVSLIDKLSLEQTLQAEIPPTLTVLQAGLTALKVQLDGLNPNAFNYQAALNNYNLASSIYDNLVRRGSAGDLSGLDTYVWQLQKIFNNNVNPTYVNTNGVIPPYIWPSSGGGSVAWSAITGKPSTILAEGIVGTGFLSNGATQYVDARLVGIAAAQILVVRGGIPQANSNLGDGDTYITKNLNDDFLTFVPAVATGEKIKISIAPL